MSVFNLVTKDRPMKVALPLDQLNHFAIETFSKTIYSTDNLISLQHKMV